MIGAESSLEQIQVRRGSEGRKDRREEKERKDQRWSGQVIHGSRKEDVRFELPVEVNDKT